MVGQCDIVQFHVLQFQSTALLLLATSSQSALCGATAATNLVLNGRLTSEHSSSAWSLLSLGHITSGNSGLLLHTE